MNAVRATVGAVSLVACAAGVLALADPSPLSPGVPSGRVRTLEPAPVDEHGAPIRGVIPDGAADRKPVMPPDASISPGRAARGPFVSVQVNVNGVGMNIAGDAANEPSIAIDPANPSLVAIGWRQFDTISNNFRQAGAAYSRDAGRTWTFPGVIQPGVFRSDPILGADGHGRFYYCSLMGDFSMQMFRSTDGGQTWGPQIPAFGGDKAWMVVDDTTALEAAVYLSWSSAAGCCANRVFTRSVDAGQTYDNPITIPSTIRFGTLALGPGGELYIIGVDSTGSTFRVDKAPSPRSGVSVAFNPAVTVNLGGVQVVGGGPNPQGLLGQAWIVVDRSNGPRRGYVYALCSVDPPGSDPQNVMFSRSQDGGATWSSPVRVNDDAPGTNAWQWFGTMSVAPNGRIDVVWNDTRNDPTATFSELYYSFSTDGGVTWSANQPASPPWNHFLGYPQQNKIGDYYHMVSDSVGATLAYAATFNGEQDVYCLRINDYDCNGNGVGDATDIANGTSMDCNTNGIPDECEIATGAADCDGDGVIDSCAIASGAAQDCNGNGVPDSCDIASGAAMDCNGNGVPDSCDIASGFSADLNNNGVPDSCELLGDLNGDGHVNAADLGILLGSWGPCPTPPTACPADLDNDGVVGASDLAILLGSWTS